MLRGRAKLLAWYRIGGYIRQNIWQLFFYWDVTLNSGKRRSRHPCLDFYERRMAPCLANPLVDSVLGLSCLLWIFAAMAPYYGLTESCRKRDAAGRFDA